LKPTRILAFVVISAGLLAPFKQAAGQRTPDFIEIIPGPVIQQRGPGGTMFCHQTLRVNNQTPYTLRKVRLAFTFGEMNYTAEIRDVVAYTEKERRLRIESLMCSAALEGRPRIRILACDMPPMRNVDCARLLRLQR